ncbi:MAG: 2-amino-4-hydroxy-6-hydroxymethyldihydropteridine diphosphokinase [Cyanobacteriota bacterium]|jgi:2-amino-4-hydroxy-6-hydroxymethyldihydropteridine diphosphokinase
MTPGLTAQSAIVALGGNVGDSRQILTAALDTLVQTPGLTLLSRSSWYETAPVGPPQPDYLNACARLHSVLSPWELLARLQGIEQEFGRRRRERWGPRTLDLDLILFGQTLIAEETLTLPHPRLTERDFVLVPLLEIAPDAVDPRNGKPLGEYLQGLTTLTIQRRLPP